MRSRWLAWYVILHKRLLKRIGFVIILCMMVLLTLLMTLVGQRDAGFVHIAVAAEQTDDFTMAVLHRLKAESNILRFTRCESPQEAMDMVASTQADTAWVFQEDLEQRVEQLVSGEQVSLVSVYAVEDTSFVRSSREKLYGALYEDIAYEMYESYVRTELPHGDSIPAETLRASYDRYRFEQGLTTMVYLDSAQDANKPMNYLTSPLRGLLMAMMLFCGLSATMMFKNDEQMQVFSMLSRPKRLAVYIANNLAALSIAGVFVTAALLASGLYTVFWRESLMMALFIIASAGLCTVLGTLCPSNTVMGAVLPTALIASLALCPVFFNVRGGWARWLMPGYYYLYGINDLSFVWPLLVYCAVVYGLAAVSYIGWNKTS